MCVCVCVCVCVSHYCAPSTEMVWLCTDWASLNIVFFGEASTYEKFGKESGLLICSHRGDLDWVGGFMVGAYYNFLHVSCVSLLSTT